MILRELEMRLRLPGSVVGAEAKMLVKLIGIDNLARIHLPVRIPGGLELAEGFHQLGTEHLGKKLGAGLSVAVLARERSTITDDEIGGFFDEASIFGDAFFRFQIEVQARVDAGMPEVSV